MSDAIIKELRRLQGLGIVSYEHCLRAERYVQRHPEIFGDRPHVTDHPACNALEDLLKARRATVSKFTVHLYVPIERSLGTRPPAALPLTVAALNLANGL